jgi:DNA-binding transcriptional regulator YiaG
MDQTTPYLSGVPCGAAWTFVIPFTLALSIGTGGYYTRAHDAMREQGPIISKDESNNLPIAAIRTAAHDISWIRSILKLTVKDLAESLGVSRQAIYDWKAGAEIKAANVARLANLKDAADVIASAQLPASPLLLRRKLPGGKSLLEAISSGVDGSEAALSLVEMVRNESEQRRFLAERFADRRSENVLGYGTPPLVEKS